ncbi:MAG: methyltransferase domain-containing protein [Lautropia sp.]
MTAAADRGAVPGPNVAFWQRRFESRATPWDRGAVNPQLEQWVRSGQLQPSSSAEARGIGGDDPRLTRVLVPGCGSGYEVAMLAEWGFDVTGVDYAPAATERTRARLRGLLTSRCGAQVNRAEVVECDVLDYRPAVLYDGVYEQTCLCALYPDHWIGYALQLQRWLRPGGKLFAMFAQVRRDTADAGFVEGPPYHCDINAMRALFPAADWEWPKPPYPAIAHPAGFYELAVILTRR